MNAALDAEIGQHRFQHPGVFLQRVIAKGMHLAGGRRIGQQTQCRKLIIAAGQIQRGLAPGAAGRRLYCLALDAAFAALGPAFAKTGGGDGFGPEGTGRVIVIIFVVVFVFVLIVRVVIVFVIFRDIIFGARAAAQQPGHIGVKAKAHAGHGPHAPRDGGKAQARGQKGQRQARQQKPQRQRPACPSGLPHPRGMGGKTHGGQTDHSARTGRQACGGGKQAKTGGDHESAKWPGQQSPDGIFQMAAHQRAGAPHEQRRQKGQRGDAEILQQNVGRHRAQRPHKIAGGGQRGIVQAGIIGGMGGQRHQRGQRRQHQQQPGAAQRGHARQPGQRAARIGQRILHGPATGARLIDTAGHSASRHVRSLAARYQRISASLSSAVTMVDKSLTSATRT